MEQSVKSILHHAERLYNARPVSENTLGNSANIIFELTTPEKPVILRASGYSGRKREHIDFELGWMDFLAGGMGHIARPVYSANKNLCEIIACDDGNQYILCVFEKAKGRIVNTGDPGEYNGELFYELGSIMGRMHAMTKNYTGYDSVAAEKFAWYNSWMFWPEYNIVTDDEVLPYEEKYLRQIHSLPKSTDTYGIIHADIQPYNFFMDNGYITLFDFDDCEFNWYAKDIAITLYQFVQMLGISNKKERVEFGESFLLSFLNGYLQANTISGYWILKLDMFMRYRRTTTYKFIRNIFRGDNPHKEYTDWLKSEILLDAPYVDIDYQKIINTCLPSLDKGNP